ncbi:MAG TPA: FtsL-like putative cell division protein [Bacteroidales bacterium]|nr:FtsL-like putative cell division protein [Bacteroidales bacterium]HSA44380.1 FtsL-like putative cell division protein [Bacteroidales bacterium]
MEEVKDISAQEAEPLQDVADNPAAVTAPSVQKKSWSLGRILQSILDGTFLTRENFIRSIPYLFFLAFLAIIYIANTYYAEKTVKSIDRAKKELKELRYEHVTVKSELMYLSKQSEVGRRLAGTGMKPSTVPPVKLAPKSEKNDK